MLRVIVLLISLKCLHANHLIDPLGYYNNPDVGKFTYDFFKTFNQLMNINIPPMPGASVPFQNGPSLIYPTAPPPIFQDVPVKKPQFKTILFNDLRPGSKKVFDLNNGKGIAFRSKDGNAGGMSFTSGNGNGFAMGGTFKGPNNGEFVTSQRGPGSKGKVMYTKQVPDFAKQLFQMFSFGKK